MTRMRRSMVALAAVWVVVGGVGAVIAQTTDTAQTKGPAQTKGTTTSGNLRLEWEFDSTRGSWQNACGKVYNDRDVAARHVLITFDGYDGAGQKVSSRTGEVVGDVPPRGYAIFCLQVKTGATRYQASVPGVDWGYAGGGQ
ncbi:MAG TPA: hypothetical protein VMS64_27155 [Candidatus Methylomirabilis sp.]|nr:hypothetical protein [Candidatus Methylomirabilis sp.]